MAHLERTLHMIEIAEDGDWSVIPHGAWIVHTAEIGPSEGNAPTGLRVWYVESVEVEDG